MNTNPLLGNVEPCRTLDVFLRFLERAAEKRPLPFRAGSIDDGSGRHLSLPGIIDRDGGGVAFTADLGEAAMYANLVNQIPTE